MGYAVASGHHQTSSAAAEVLAAGGSAVDACIAGAFVACAAEPILVQLLGGGFLMVAPADGAPQLLDAFVETPRQKARNEDTRTISVDFGNATQEFHIGAGTVAVPGLVPGLFEAHRRFGRIPMPDLVAPAVKLAKSGVRVTPFQAQILQLVRAIVADTPGSRALHFEGDKPLEPGSTFRNPEFADVLEVLGCEGPRFFQEGEIAQSLLRSEGSHLSASDLRNYAPIWRKPLIQKRRDIQIALNPAPSLGGTQIALGLAALPDAPDMATIAACLRSIAKIRQDQDVDHHPSEVESRMLATDLVKTLRDTLRNRRGFGRGTTHISVIDPQGNGAAITLSNGEGNGQILPGTGIMPNNMLGEDDLIPDGPGSWHPGQRLASMMSPSAMISHIDHRLVMIGSGGSNRIRSAMLQTILRLVDGGEDLAQAIEAPRLHFELTSGLDVEAGFSEGEIDALGKDWPEANFWHQTSMYFGGVHAAELRGSHYEAAGDPRREGHATTA